MKIPSGVQEAIRDQVDLTQGKDYNLDIIASAIFGEGFKELKAKDQKEVLKYYTVHCDKEDGMPKIIDAPKKAVAAAAGMIKHAAGNAKDLAGDGAEVLAEKAVDAKVKIDKAWFRPIYDIDEIDSTSPRVIHVADNQRMRDTDACDGAIGHIEKIKGMKMIRMLPENVTLPGIRFYPNTGGALYYRDPYEDHVYINLDNYFDYMNEIRVNELKNVAHDLGAKHIRIVYKEEKKTLVSADAKAKASAKNRGKIKIHPEGEGEVKHSKDTKEYNTIDVLAEVDYDGSDAPEMPTLLYLKGDPAIKSLIKRRMDGDRSIKRETYTIKCDSLKGIHQEDVAKLDGMLKYLKIGGNASFSSEVEAENRAVLEYTIEF